MKSQGAAVFAIVLLGILFVAGLYGLFSMRFSSGDLYPDYSSFRADPKGTKALHDAMDQIETFSVSRKLDIVLFKEEPVPSRSLILALGASSRSVAIEGGAFWELLEDKARQGATVLIALQSESGLSFLDELDEEVQQAHDDEETSDEEEESQSGREEDESDEGLVRRAFFSDWLKEMGVSVERRSESDPEFEWLNRLSGDSFVARPAYGRLREALHLKSNTIFVLGEDAGWQTLYRLNGRPAAIVRPMDEGRLMLVSDAYPFSNEGLLNHRNAEWFGWLFQDIQDLQFFEAHLGVEYKESIISLARKHGFTVALIALVAAASIFIWRCSFSLIPRKGEDSDETKAFGMESASSGLQNMIRRSIPKKRICRASYEAWLQSPLGKRLSGRRKELAAANLDRYESSRGGDEDAAVFYKSMHSLTRSHHKK